MNPDITIAGLPDRPGTDDWQVKLTAFQGEIQRLVYGGDWIPHDAIWAVTEPIAEDQRRREYRASLEMGLGGNGWWVKPNLTPEERLAEAQYLQDGLLRMLREHRDHQSNAPEEPTNA